MARLDFPGYRPPPKIAEAFIAKVTRVLAKADTVLFCHGPLVRQSLWATILSPVSRFCPGSARDRHLMGSDEERVGQSKNARSSAAAPQ
jgi:hypothetical protein